MHDTHTTASGAQLNLGMVLEAGALLAWLAAIALEVSTPQATAWSVPWIGAYILAIASALVTGRTRRAGVHQWLGYSSALLTGSGAVIRTAFPTPHPPAAGALTAVDIPLSLGLGLTTVGIVLCTIPSAREPGGTDTRFAVGVGLLLVWSLTLLTEYVARPNLWHGSEFYIVTGAVLPVAFAFATTASSGKWTATKVAAVHMVLLLLAMWAFQVVPLQESGPGGEHRRHLLSPPFPLILVVPAIIVDRVLGHLRVISPWWRRAAVMGLTGVKNCFQRMSTSFKYGELAARTLTISNCLTDLNLKVLSICS